MTILTIIIRRRTSVPRAKNFRLLSRYTLNLIIIRILAKGRVCHLPDETIRTNLRNRILCHTVLESVAGEIMVVRRGLRTLRVMLNAWIRLRPINVILGHRVPRNTFYRVTKVIVIRRVFNIFTMYANNNHLTSERIFRMVSLNQLGTKYRVNNSDLITANMMNDHTNTIVANMRHRHGVAISASKLSIKQDSTHHLRLDNNVHALFRARVTTTNIDHNGRLHSAKDNVHNVTMVKGFVRNRHLIAEPM